jgi:hypothetical protein
MRTVPPLVTTRQIRYRRDIRWRDLYEADGAWGQSCVPRATIGHDAASLCTTLDQIPTRKLHGRSSCFGWTWPGYAVTLVLCQLVSGPMTPSLRLKLRYRAVLRPEALSSAES